MYATAQSGDTLYIGGDFTYVGSSAAAYFTPIDASTAQPNVTWAKPNGTVYSAVPDGSGGWYIGGEFTQVGDSSRNRLAHINALGGVTAWNPNASNTVYTLAVSGTTVYVGGEFTNIGGQSRNRIAALDAATGTATAWNPNTLGLVYTLAVSGTTVYAGGQFNNIGGQNRRNVAALDIVTGMAIAWDPNTGGSGFDVVYTLAVSGTTVYAGGYFTSICGQNRPLR